VTLGINVIGSFALGAFLTTSPSWLSESARVALTVGFLGAFTTFSTFSYESQALLRAGRHTAALAYVALSIVLGVAAAAAGYVRARALD